jgi:hypothetical protein
MTPAPEMPAAGGAGAPPFAAPSRAALRWLIGLRLVVISTLFLGILIIQVNTQQLLQLEQFYWLILVSYGLSLGYLVLYLRGLPTRLQAVIQLLGDIGVVTGCVYFTGGLYSPFSFLYLTVIMVAATMLRGGGLVFAGLSAIAYGVLVDLMVFGVVPEFMHTGLAYLLYDEFEKAIIRKGYWWCELSWQLEDNQAINLFAQSIGAKLYRKYRIYEKPISAAGA